MSGPTTPCEPIMGAGVAANTVNPYCSQQTHIKSLQNSTSHRDVVKWFFMEGLLANDDVESTSNLRRIYVESMSNPNLHRIYIESTSNLRRIEAWENPGACF